jgi:hypothetical protein
MDQNPPLLALLIPIIAIVMGIGVAMLAIYVSYQRRKDMFALYHQERMAAIEKGVDLPPLPENFFREDGGPLQRSPHRTLLTGLIMVFIGVTLYLALHFARVRTDEGGDAGLFALIPAGIGVAYLIYYFTVGRKLALAMEAEKKARQSEAAQARNPPA